MKPDRVALDLLSCRDRLAEIASELEHDAGRPDLFAELAILLGRHRLFQVPAPDLLTPSRAVHAAEALLARLPKALRRARRLRRVWDECEEIDEATSASAALLEDRLDAWAACVALEDVQNRLEAENPLDSLVSQLWDAVADLDDAMTAEAALFACVAESGETALWRAALADEFADPLPWFLDPSLEQDAARGRAAAEETVLRAVGLQPLAWSSPDGRCRVEMARTAEGCALSFSPAEGMEGKCVWLGGHIGHIEKGRALVRVPPWDVGPGLELAVGQPGARWPRSRVAE